jgi:hypothetical protein
VNEIAITFDQDWAPDYMTAFVLNQLEARGVKSTWFITHKSPVLDRLKESPFVEIGIHPNFLQGTTQGKNTTAIMDGLMAICPGAKAVRTHAMVYSASLARVFALYRIPIDSSVYLGGMAGIKPFKAKYPTGERITRMPYFWSDDGELTNGPEWRLWDCEGLKILCFHPVHCFLNTAAWDDYLIFRKELKSNPKMDPADAAKWATCRKGTWNFLGKVICAQQTFRTLSEIAHE